MNYSEKLLKALESLVIGQKDSFQPIIRKVMAYMAGVSPANRPVGVFFLSGPTGTGKTHTVQSLARCLHGSPDKLLRIDCGEFTRNHEVAKILGAPPGYIGHGETKSRISDEVLRSLESEDCKLKIILLDEIEKAAPDFLRLFLGVFDRAKMTLDNNKSVDFSDTLIFMTSNLGQDKIEDELKGGYGLGSFTKKPVDTEKIKKMVETAAKDVLPPEFVNRIDSWINYKPLTKQDVSAIFDLEVRKFNVHLLERLHPEHVVVKVEDKAKAKMIDKGYSEKYGARNLKRVLEDEVTYPISEMLVEKKVAPGDTVVFKLKGGKIVTEVITDNPQEAAA
jgi:ATP-dependent Clp protease ATP-binding subunit ClpC